VPGIGGFIAGRDSEAAGKVAADRIGNSSNREKGFK
jgi:hypothetical protein